MSYFDRFAKNWASTGIVIPPSDAQADAGFAYLGPVPPSVEGFNAMFQWNDGKDNWLYHQIANVIISAGDTVTEGDLTGLLDAINAKIAANNPAGIYLPLTGGTLAGPGNLTVNGSLKANSGRIVSSAASNPSIAIGMPGATPFTAGFWVSGTQMNFGIT